MKRLLQVMAVDALLLAGFVAGLLLDWGVITWVFLGLSVVGTPMAILALLRSARVQTDLPSGPLGR